MNYTNFYKNNKHFLQTFVVTILGKRGDRSHQKCEQGHGQDNSEDETQDIKNGICGIFE